jgi:hypothetical protein
VKRGEVDFRVGNNARVVALTVGTMQLQLPLGFILELINCYLVPSMSRNIMCWGPSSSEGPQKYD